MQVFVTALGKDERGDQLQELIRSKTSLTHLCYWWPRGCSVKTLVSSGLGAPHCTWKQCN